MPAVGTRVAPIWDAARSVSTTMQDTVHSTKRALKHAREGAMDAYDDTVHRVRRHPLKAVAISIGAGTILGLACGLLLGRGGRNEKS